MLVPNQTISNRLLLIAIAVFVLMLLFPGIQNATGTEPPKGPVFEKQVFPIFQAKCLKCHGDKKQRAALDLRSKGAMLQGGDSGPALTPGSAKKSLLWKQIITDKMPPGKGKLSQAEKGILRAWIETGAFALNNKIPDPSETVRQVTDEDRQFRSFQKPTRPEIPKVKNDKLVSNPIDAFVLAFLEKNGLTFSPEADRMTLLRRATFDLLGLPPSPKQIEEFLSDKKAGAYERLIDRLLASPHYGERWARHWLDAAGYADSEGILDADYVRAAAWRYRDYVIRAFNKDTPYNLFLKQQLAGDELVNYWQEYQTKKMLSPEVIEAVTATGFLRCASDTSRPDFVNIKNAPGYYFQTLDDTVKIVSTSLLGLTVQCAKCHSHKYDPIPQRDYYKIQAIFMSGYRPAKWIPQVQRRLLEATSAQEKQAKEHNGKVNAEVAKLQKQKQDLQKEFADRLFQKSLEKLPKPIRKQVSAAFNTDAKKRTKEQLQLVKKYQAQLRPVKAALAKALTDTYPTYKTKTAQFDESIKAEQQKIVKFQEIRAFYDLPGDAKTYLLQRGDYLHPGKEIRPGVLAVLATPKAFDWQPPPKETRTSGRRLAFAEWLTQPEHPLTTRVFVNRLWMHHFGEGIVSTPDNFGHTGSPPSHPQLLDWLATEFVARGWSIKRMHWLIMTSHTYRQKSTFVPKLHAQAKKIDPENRLLWRQRLHRLEAEALRDAVLHVAGTLNTKMFGPPVPMQRRPDGEIVVPTNDAGAKRSIYLQVRRSQPLTFLGVFDQPVMQTNCTRRDTSTVSSQALTLLNSDFMVRQAKAFADRVLREKADDPAGHAMLLAYGRQVNNTERKLLTTFLQQQSQRHLQTLTKGKATDAQRQQAQQKALADLCHMLLTANEFAYVD